MIIKILGSGCPKCNRLEQLARDAVAELGAEAEFEHVRQMADIMQYDIMATPALVINEQVKSSGRIPQMHEISGWIQEAQVS